ncbi:MAG: nucleotide exchange factor GrpE [Acidimicrobiia bacterium]
MSDADEVRDDVVADETEAEAAAAEAVETDLDRLAAERNEYLDTLRRLQADFENYKKRVARDHEDRVARANEGLLTQLLDVLDSFELAIAHLEDSDDVEKLRKGVEQVYAQLVGTLEKGGLTRIDSDDAVFDPELHEAVLHEDGDADIPTVVQTMRAGYRLHGRVLRPAMVKVAK